MGTWQFSDFDGADTLKLKGHGRRSGPLFWGGCAQAILWSCIGIPASAWSAPPSANTSASPVHASVVSPSIRTAILNPKIDAELLTSQSGAELLKNLSDAGTPLPIEWNSTTILASQPVPVPEASLEQRQSQLQPNDSTQEFQPSVLAPSELLNLTPERIAQAPPLNPGESPLPPVTPPSDSVQLDPELGNLRLQELQLQPPPPKSLYLLGGINFFSSNNIFASIDPVEDGLVRSGLSLLYTPALGPATYLVTSVQGNVVRYFNLPFFSYNELQFEAGIYQQLSPTMYGQVGWTNQQLFTVETGERFLSENSLRLTLGRSDRLTDQLSLDSFYQLRWGLADPDIRSRVINYLGVGLSYDIQPDLEAALEYQVSITSFTQVNRTDVYNQVVARLSYQFLPEARVSLIGGYSFGGSTTPGIKFDGSILGITLDLSVPLF